MLCELTPNMYGASSLNATAYGIGTAEYRGKTVLRRRLLGQRDDLALRGRGLGRPQVCLGTGRIAARPTRGFPLDQSPSLG